jgi:uncharacterized membrane protein
MLLAPLLNAPTAIQIHAFAAMSAFIIGHVQLYRTKGTPSHRATGYVWVTIMVVVAASGFWIHEIRLWGPWSPIHLLSIFTLVMLPVGVVRAHACRAPVDHDLDLRGGTGHRRFFTFVRAHHARGSVRQLSQFAPFSPPIALKSLAN